MKNVIELGKWYIRGDGVPFSVDAYSPDEEGILNWFCSDLFYRSDLGEAFFPGEHSQRYIDAYNVNWNNNATA